MERVQGKKKKENEEEIKKMTHYKPDLLCKNEKHYEVSDCFFCFAEKLSEHVRFENGVMILKNVRLED